jgi:hypothetical protein
MVMPPAADIRNTVPQPPLDESEQLLPPELVVP